MISDKTKHYFDAAPLLIVVCLLPFIVYGHIYEYSGEEYGAFIDGVLLSDFFSYGKALIFGAVGVYMLFRIAVDMMQGRMERPCIVLIACILVMGISLLISSIFALNNELAVFGGYQRFEGALTKFFYLVLALYTYRMIAFPEVWKAVWKGSIITAALECLIGLMQMTGYDPFAMKSVQRLIVPAQYGGAEIKNILGDNRVYLTLANPNYAAMYLAVVIILISCSLGSIRSRKWTVCLAALDVLCFAEMIATRSRVGLLMLITASLLWLTVSINSLFEDRKRLRSLGLLVFAMIAAGIAADAVMGLGAWSRIGTSLSTLGEKQVNCRITGLETTPKCVKVEMDDVSIEISYKNPGSTNELSVKSVKQGTGYGRYDPGKGMIVDDRQHPMKGLEKLIITVEPLEAGESFSEETEAQETEILVKESGAEFFFIHEPGYGYLIYAGNGYYEEAGEIDYIDLHGLESAASGRGYIWSRTIPLMSGARLISGYGSDNFYLAFPQNDYVGKAQYCDGPNVIIEKPHNTYLLYGVENGIPAMISFIALIFFLIFRLMKQENRSKPDCKLIALVVIALAAGFFFNDSSIVISPLLWIALGAGYRFTT